MLTLLTGFLMFFQVDTTQYQEWMPAFMQAEWIQAVTGIAIVLAVAYTAHLLLKNVFLRVIQSLIRRSPIEWDDVLFENKVPRRALLLIPLIIIRVGLEMVQGLSPEFEGFLQRLVVAMMILIVVRVVDGLITSLHDFYQKLPMAERRPIKSYIQLIKVFIYAIGAIFMVAQLADQSPWYFLSGLGAMTAILMLIFQDTILSLVASVQLTNNDLVRVGDWIEMPQFNADGDVIDIALNTVKVKNWDKTVTVIPTHKFLQNSFRNWRQMFDGGGRRIKRSIHINSSSIRFLTEEEIAHFSKFRLLNEYIEGKILELQEHNSRNGADMTIPANARHLTNVGTLRAYIIAYIKNHPGIHPDMTQMVRQLEPTPEGVPIEIYTFTNDTRWVYYEGIQADIFDHILAIIPEFGLRVYQRPSGYDLDGVVRESAS